MLPHWSLCSLKAGRKWGMNNWKISEEAEVAFCAYATTTWKSQLSSSVIWAAAKRQGDSYNNIRNGCRQGEKNPKNLHMGTVFLKAEAALELKTLIRLCEVNHRGLNSDHNHISDVKTLVTHTNKQDYSTKRRCWNKNLIRDNRCTNPAALNCCVECESWCYF